MLHAMPFSFYISCCSALKVSTKNTANLRQEIPDEEEYDASSSFMLKLYYW